MLEPDTKQGAVDSGETSGEVQRLVFLQIVGKRFEASLTE